MRPIKAERKQVYPNFITMAEIDEAKVAALVGHMRAGGKVPPVVVAIYGDKLMPLDGHHRLSACARLGVTADAWVVNGRSFDRLCTEHRSAEDLVLCDGIPAMQVAAKWQPTRKRRGCSLKA